MVVVIDRHDPDAKLERRRFLTMPSELQQLSLGLRDRGMEQVVMDGRRSTGAPCGWSWNRTCTEAAAGLHGRRTAGASADRQATDTEFCTERRIADLAQPEPDAAAPITRSRAASRSDRLSA